MSPPSSSASVCAQHSSRTPQTNPQDFAPLHSVLHCEAIVSASVPVCRCRCLCVFIYTCMFRLFVAAREHPPEDAAGTLGLIHIGTGIATSAPGPSHIFSRPMPHLHRDLRQDDTEIALSDFGLAKLFDEDHAKVTGSTRVSPWALQYATVWTWIGWSAQRR